MNIPDNTKIIWLGRSFLLPFFAPFTEVVHIPNAESAYLIEQHGNATFLICLNDTVEEHRWRRDVLTQAGKLGIPRCWWNIEDPNAFGYFAQNVRRLDFDFVFTTDRKYIQPYQRRTIRRPRARGFKVYWMPLAASPSHHYAQPPRPDASDFVLVAQSYLYWAARKTAVKNLIRPLLASGYSLSLFCPEDGWAEEPEIRQHRIGGENYREDCSEYYSHGRVALGINCQSGTDIDPPGFQGTSMTSMRTFEVLACHKPFLAYESTAYEQLGFRNGKHFYWAGQPGEARQYAEELLKEPEKAASLALKGREFVLANHTYQHRLDRMLRIVRGQRADAFGWA